MYLHFLISTLKDSVS